MVVGEHEDEVVWQTQVTLSLNWPGLHFEFGAISSHSNSV